MEDLKKIIRDVPDFPKKGIIFKDIAPLLGNGPAFKKVINWITSSCKNLKIDKVVGAEARGFMFAAPAAAALNAGFVPARKPGKLPYKTISEEFALEYGTDKFEMHEDAVKKGENVLIVDDLLATGGTAEALVKLVKRLGGNVVGVRFIIELEFLNGLSKLKGCPVETLIKY